ncbi:hypothetical protein FKM82_019778 [Ascaphus truei]
MDFTLIWVFLTIFASCAHSDPALTQADPQMLKKPNDSIKLTCRGAGFDFSQYGMNWVRQAPGKGLEWLGVMWYDASKTVYFPSVEGRLVITRNNADSVTFMEFKDLVTADTAMYYCAKRKVTVSPRPSIQKHSPSVRNPSHH